MHRPPHPDEADDQALPCPQALLGATLALMSAWAQPLADSPLPPAGGQPLLARKIVSNLFFLHHHPTVGAALRALAGRLHGHWVAVAQGGASAACTTATATASASATTADAAGAPCLAGRVRHLH